MSALLDTGFLLAVLDGDDEHHAACKASLLAESKPLLPDVDIPELAYMVLRELGYDVLVAFLNSLFAGELVVAQTKREDWARAAQILAKYADSRVDFVDCMIVAMAERLNIQRILTVDKRHFSLFRPSHHTHFEIVP